MSSYRTMPSEWLLNHWVGKMVLWVLERVAYVVGFLTLLALIWTIDTRFFPVIQKWTLDYVERDGGFYVLEGTLEKKRACKLIATSIMAVPKQPLAPRVLIYQIKPDELIGGDAPTGHSTWGPWRMEIPKTFITHREHISFLEVVGTHNCHGFWSQETLYGTVPMERLP